MNPFAFFAVIAVLIVAGLVEALIDSRIEARESAQLVEADVEAAPEN